MIEVTDIAHEKLLEKSKSHGGIRIALKPGGCAGFEYKFDYLDVNKKPLDNSKGLECTHDRIRTCDLRIRSPLLYPAELRGHSHLI